ncbi:MULTISPECIES: Dps family protein [Halomonas]|uniref:DNA starvation/stationary phase protection protein n=3 Tax=Halomonas TaxID=2745 RepID=A0AAU7KKZ6_9GAMM|nr:MULTISPECIES: Dps family protein [Halomonas]MBR9769835.1 DNA starvation/stationary phase protection protein [Gammaproteobacteria bacterium]MAY69998.1 DNA starvation/stationary phase protection protein [Halomonas sp.]MBR9878165.1 DNA starvation/stationary phase protection protein [Gammaproteobacteria bacterium]MBS8270151.1 DNA starvation/stationary phase protection protein [Halomonas litopenaei]MCJ8284518.1 DNA starvation/stationary phase protection protein [Halomonas sp.]|tara:strand:+ start:299 stop:772 length:474 start_codon:yes stop_codon:yes gene_type:complete
MSDTNAIGLHSGSASDLAEKLNELLANYQIFYMNVRGYHWNVKGSNFFELHEKFEEFYTDLLAKVDEVAERILTLGHKPVHAYSDYISLSRITEAKDVHDGEACVRGVLEGYQRLIELQREILSVASDADDEGTASQVGDYIREQEKTVWMLGAYLG